MKLMEFKNNRRLYRRNVQPPVRPLSKYISSDYQKWVEEKLSAATAEENRQGKWQWQCDGDVKSHHYSFAIFW